MNKKEEFLKEINGGILRGAQATLAKKIDVSPASVMRWLSGAQTVSEEYIKKMSKIFKKSEEEIRSIFTSEEKSGDNPTPIIIGQKVGYVPMLGEAFADRFKCIVCEQEPELFLPVVKQGDKDFALRILGDCMVDPKDPVNSIYEGNYVIIRPKVKVAKGDVVLARKGEDCTIKRFYTKGNQIHLVPDNPKYKTIIGDINDIEIMGKVIQVHRPIRKKKNPDYYNEPSISVYEDNDLGI